jgi:TonB family protein
VCEALTRVRPSDIEGSGEATLPVELPATFRGVVARCLSPDPLNRPTVAQLQGWLRGEAPIADTSLPARSLATRLVIRVELPPEEQASMAEIDGRPRWRVIPLVIAAVVLGAVGWFGWRLLSTPSSQSRSTLDGTTQLTLPRVELPPPARPAAAAAPAIVATPAAEPPASLSPRVNEVLPVVSQSSLDTIRGTVRVSVQVIVGKEGTVLSATPAGSSPSAFFERRSLDAARKWTFAPVESEAKRSMRLRFNFTRSGVTADAEPLR